MNDYRIQVDVKGLDELKRAFDSSPRTISENLSIAINRTAAFIEGKAKTLAPIKYGALRGSIHTDEAKASQGLEMRATVGTDLKYAYYQEHGVKPFGTKTAKSLIATDGSGNVTAWFKRSRGFAGKFYFKQSKEQGSPMFESNVKNAIGDIIRGLAR